MNVWSRLIIIIQAIGPDGVVRAVKMVNTLGMQGEINTDEMRSEIQAL